MFNKPLENDYFWNKKNHTKFPKDLQHKIEAVFMYIKKDNLLGILSKDIWLIIFNNYYDKCRYESNLNNYYDNKIKNIKTIWNCSKTDSDKLSYHELVKKYYTHLEAQEHINILYKCKCCKRHQINKPHKIMKNFIETVYTYPSNHTQTITNYCNCLCDCRHLIRSFNRVFCEKHEYYFPEYDDNEIEELSCYNNYSGSHGY